MSLTLSTTYTGNGATDTYAIPFAYDTTDQVVVTWSNGTPVYTFPSAGFIKLSAVLANGQTITISRLTNTDAAAQVFQAGSGIPRSKLNSAVNQLLYAVQELWAYATKLRADFTAAVVAAGNVPLPGAGNNLRALFSTGTASWAWRQPVTADVSDYVTATDARVVAGGAGKYFKANATRNVISTTPVTPASDAENIATAGANVINMPAATLGALYKIRNLNAAVALTINRNGTDTFVGGGTSLTLAIGARIVLGCLTAGSWDTLEALSYPVGGGLVNNLTGTTSLTAVGTPSATVDPVADALTFFDASNSGLISQSTPANLLRTDAKFASLPAPDFHAQDQKASATAGGSSLAGANTRVLNTSLRNVLSWTLSANQIVLPAGTYYVRARATNYAGGPHKLYWFNVTGSTVVLSGATMNANAANVVSNDGTVEGVFTIGGSTTFELRHFITTVAATNGLGFPSGSGQSEVYAEVQIWKVDK
jgi:hypothetical protein